VLVRTQCRPFAAPSFEPEIDGGVMMHTGRAGSLVSAALLLGIAGLPISVQGGPTFIPNNQQFWDDSSNWTTDYGPAYRDTVEKPENIVPCMGDFALCFTSGPEPLPCELSNDGRTANCTCTAHSRLNFVRSARS
jgi:hypothetical protein